MDHSQWDRVPAAVSSFPLFPLCPDQTLQEGACPRWNHATNDTPRPQIQITDLLSKQCSPTMSSSTKCVSARDMARFITSLANLGSAAWAALLGFWIQSEPGTTARYSQYYHAICILTGFFVLIS